MNNIQKVKQLGQQIWLDNLSRSLIKTGKLNNLIDSEITGITSNPAIFAKAIKEDNLYLDEIALLKHNNISAKQRYEILAIKDIQDACEAFASLYQNSNRQYGYVSIELDPKYANDFAKSIEEAKHLWKTINKPNVMIKVPMTDIGLNIFQELIAEGMNVNATLLFSLEKTKKLHQAFLQGIKTRLDNGLPINTIRSVASFFMSRIDNALDITLPANLQGQVAISIAKQAYQDWLDIFDKEQLKLLHTHQAEPIWLLWASTGTKNPKYSDVLYVDSLIGANTVNTLPEKTLNLFLDHGNPQNSLTQDVNHAKKILAEVENLGISLENLATRLTEEGLLQFEEAFLQIMNDLS